MEIGPILRTLFYNKPRFVLISLEVALTLAIVVNCVNMVLEMRQEMLRPSGFDEENILVATLRPFGPELVDEDYAKAVREADLRLARSLPGVRAAAQLSSVPLSGGGSSTGRKVVSSELDTISSPYFTVTEEALETLGAELVAGRDFTPEDFGVETNHNVILSQAMADRLFPDGNALGRQITNDDGDSVNTVVGIVGHMLNSWPGSSIPDSAMLIPEAPSRRERYSLLVRAEPGAFEDLYTRLEDALAASHSGRAVEVTSLAEVRADTFRSNDVIIDLLAGVMALLVLVTALGIVGLTSFSVTQRTQQIGVRRALGATKNAILRYFLTENWIVTTLGLVLGVGLAYLLNYTLMQYADGVKLSWHLVAAGALFLWTVGLLAALSPALRGTRVAPVVATRSV